MVTSQHHGQSSYTIAQSSSHDRHQKHPKHPKHSSSRIKHNGPVLDQPGVVDFVFVVIETAVSEAYMISPEYDCWFNPLPPGNHLDFVPVSREIAHVYRYRDGDVSDVSEYYTAYHHYDIDQEPDFTIFRMFPDPSGSAPQLRPCVPYGDGTTVFNCGPALPAIILDADVFSSSTVAYTDEYCSLRASNGLANSWKPLGLQVCGEVTRIDNLTAGSKYVAPGASWIPSIVPELYRSPWSQTIHEGHRLGGDFGVIIGLMALGQAPDQLHDAFSRHWRGHQWLARHSRGPFMGMPYGMVVRIALDPDLQDPGLAGMAISHMASVGATILNSTASSSRPRHSRH